jgi:hypothetical protein
VGARGESLSGFVMPKRLGRLAVPFVAGAIIALTTISAWAFTRETLAPNGNYNFDYGPSGDKDKSDKSTNKSDPNSSGFHFSIEHGQPEPFGYHSFGSDSHARPPDYSRPLGNGD